MGKWLILPAGVRGAPSAVCELMMVFHCSHRENLCSLDGAEENDLILNPDTFGFVFCSLDEVGLQ